MPVFFLKMIDSLDYWEHGPLSSLAILYAPAVMYSIGYFIHRSLIQFLCIFIHTTDNTKLEEWNFIVVLCQIHVYLTIHHEDQCTAVTLLYRYDDHWCGHLCTTCPLINQRFDYFLYIRCSDVTKFDFIYGSHVVDHSYV